MRRLSLIAAALLASLATTPAQGQEQGQGQERGGPRGERFFIALPEGWTEAARSTQQGANVVAYVPQGQSAEQWADMLTLQVYNGLTALPARAFYERAIANVQKTCDGPQAGDLQTGLSNGYPSAFWVLGCGRNRATGQGETSFFRLIQGDSALYMAQRTWRTKAYVQDGPPVAPAQAEQAVELLSSFSVCNPLAEGDAHPCPAVGAR